MHIRLEPGHNEPLFFIEDLRRWRLKSAQKIKTASLSKKKPDGYDKRVWLQTRRIQSFRRAIARLAVTMINFPKEFVNKE